MKLITCISFAAHALKAHAQSSKCFPQAIVRLYHAGQPIPSTHPELLAQGEITPGITAREYAARRERLVQMLPPGGVAVVPAAPTHYMVGVIPYKYRQDADMFYLTGINQHAVAVLEAVPHQGKNMCKFTLFVEPNDHEVVRWDGYHLDSEAAAQVFGAHQVFNMDQLPKQLSSMVAEAPIVRYDYDRQAGYQQQALAAALGTALARRGVQLLRVVTHAMRAVKSDAEIRLLRASASLSAQALHGCIATTRPGVREYELAAKFEYECKRRGASRMSYPPVVAAGPDACTVHYGRNDKVMRSGQMVLMDAGCEYHGYVSDVTRTWPVNGKFSEPQRDLYNVVLDVHKRCLAACDSGTTMRRLHALSVRLISEGLKDLGICGQASLDDILNTRYRDFYCHSVGHFLGLDTHDAAVAGPDFPLTPGCVITIEPGLYIPDEERYGHYRGQGIRIEDDVLITGDGHEVMSRQVPIEMSEIEDVIAGNRPV